MDVVRYFNFNYNRMQGSYTARLRKFYNKFKNLGITMHYENKEKGRIILSTTYDQSDFSNPLCRKSNGIIVQFDFTNEKPDFKIIARPPGGFNFRPKMQRLVKLKGKYKIYKARDGTTITLYYYDNKWTIATTRGYDVSNFNWLSSKNYTQVFEDVIKECTNFTSFDEFTDQLDKNCSYTIGFSHPDYQPFNNKYDLWFIVSYSTVTNKYSYNSTIEYIPNQEELEEESFKTLFTNSKNALEKWRTDNDVNFGYILRSTSPNVKDYSDVLIESSLMRSIRNIFYNTGVVRSNAVKNHKDRIRYIAFSSFMNIRNAKLFTELFPKYKHYYNEFEKLIQKIVTRMISSKDDTSNFGHDNFDRTIAGVKNFVQKNLTLTETNRQQIADIIKVPQNINKFYTLL